MASVGLIWGTSEGLVVSHLDAALGAARLGEEFDADPRAIEGWARKRWSNPLGSIWGLRRWLAYWRLLRIARKVLVAHEAIGCEFELDTVARVKERLRGMTTADLMRIEPEALGLLLDEYETYCPFEGIDRRSQSQRTMVNDQRLLMQ